MRRNWKRAVCSFVVLALFAALCLGCAKEEEEVATIVIGEIIDLTGVAAVSCIQIHYVVALPTVQ